LWNYRNRFLKTKGALINLNLEKAIEETENFLAEKQNDIPLGVFNFMKRICDEEKKVIEMAKNWSNQKTIFKVKV
jgi:hypothetical protein